MVGQVFDVSVRYVARPPSDTVVSERKRDNQHSDHMLD